MKLTQLFETGGKNLIGLTIDRKKITEKTPETTWSGDFICKDLKLVSLRGAPKILTGATIASRGDFVCSNNFLDNIEGCPREVNEFDCQNNNITSLKGSPDVVKSDYDCRNNKLTSLEGITPVLGTHLYCAYNQLTSLKDIHKHVKKMNGTFSAHSNPIKSHVLGVLLIEGCKKFKCDNGNNFNVQDIVNKYLPNTRGHRAVAECQNELIEADLDEFAQI